MSGSSSETAQGTNGALETRLLAAGEHTFGEKEGVRADVHDRLFGRDDAGASIDRYVIRRRVGRGGMGVVYAAYDPRLDREVAVKVLHPEALGRRRVDASNLLREARTLARLAHPNVVPVFDAGTVDEAVYIAMELVSGETLEAWLQRTNPDWRRVVRVFLEASAGLGAAHHAGILHRDFKPTNVVIGADGRARILDFGIAVVHDDAQSDEQPGADSTAPAASRPTTVSGTPAYMSPERHRALDGDERSDIYSFCVALHEALYRVRPFDGRLHELLDKKETLTLQEIPAAVRRRVPAALRKLVLRGLAPHPSGRPGSMDEVTRTLRAQLGWSRLQKVGAALAVVTVASAGVALSSRDEPAACADASEQLAGIWDGDVRAQTQAAFAASGRAFADDAWRLVARKVDDYAQQWHDQRQALCEASLPDAEFAVRNACLANRLGELAALTEILAAADGVAVERAMLAVDELPPLQRCGSGAATDDAALGGGGATVELDAALARAHARETFGFRSGALEASRYALALAQQDNHPQSQMRAHVQLGVVLALDGREVAAAVEEFESALTLAEQVGDDRTAARALVHLYGIAAPGVDGSRDRERLARMARAKLDRIGGDAFAESLLLNHEGIALIERGRPDEAVVLLNAALELREATFGSNSARVAATLNNIAYAYFEAAQPGEAASTLERVVELDMVMFGPNHPISAEHRMNLALAHAGSGRTQRAIEMAGEAVDAAHNSLEANHPRFAAFMLNAGSVYLSAERWADARAQFDAVLQMPAAPGPEGPMPHAKAHFGLATIDGQHGRWTRTVEHLEVGIELLEGAEIPAAASQLPEAWRRLAVALGNAGAPADRVEAAHRRAVTAADAVRAPRMAPRPVRK